MTNITLSFPDTAADHGAVSLIVPHGMDMEFHRFRGIRGPAGWTSEPVKDADTGQGATVFTPPSPRAEAVISYDYDDDASSGPAPVDIFVPENSPRVHAAADLAQDMRSHFDAVGGGENGIAAIVQDVADRFEYANLPPEMLYHAGEASVPLVACAAGNCIDINLFLVAALRACDVETAYLTCLYQADEPGQIEPGMHCWVRTRHSGRVQDWDIAHFKKVAKSRILPGLNPVPGRRWTLCYGRDHRYLWQGKDIVLSTPSRPQWVQADGTAIWGDGPEMRVREEHGAAA
ncbi:MAG: transglutaminase domain-containing protein [Pseudomonadota bacterium]